MIADRDYDDADDDDLVRCAGCGSMIDPALADCRDDDDGYYCDECTARLVRLGIARERTERDV